MVARASYEFRRRVEALRAPLLAVSRDSFGGLDERSGLGAELRDAFDRMVGCAQGDLAAALLGWRRKLDGFEALDSTHKAVEVARGLRLSQGLGGPAPTVSKSTSKANATSTSKVGLGPLASPTQVLPGIGPAMAERLLERGIATVEDLLWLVPRRYDDVRAVAPMAVALETAEAGQRVTASGIVYSCRFNRRGRVRWVDLRLADADVAGCRLVVRFFNAHFSMTKRFAVGHRVLLSGTLQRRDGGHELANPDILAVGPPDAAVAIATPIISRYADLVGVPAGTLRKACRAAVEKFAGELPDAVPENIAERLGLPPLADAIRLLHAPPDTLSVAAVETLNRGESEWHRRLAFDELFVLGVVVARRRVERRADAAVACEAAAQARGELQHVLSFTPTGAQERAIRTIAADLEREVPMNRLLQGDVGSGKTAVAFAAALQVIRSGRQVAIMAPTEILAQQHHATFASWCETAAISCALLTASTPRGVRASTLSRLAAGQLSLVIGTHSLLSDAVDFSALGLAIVDEQHRFGVAQRVRLRDKGDDDGVPHLLVMTATPIPRTLALTAYGDLDVSIIDELPPGRQPVTTTVMSGARRRQRTYQRVKARVAKGTRAFVVCPLVEPADPEESRADWANAVSVSEELCEQLAPARIGLVHGRMAKDVRDEVMDSFRRGLLDVLVATTVIEVGVDVPEATLMIIEDADRFGLAQLHQLRGRVGRGSEESHCVLLTRGRKTPDGARRLEIMASTTDGFRIAEEDLLIRGPGELLGSRQAGLPKLRFGDLTQHTELLVQARSEADGLLAEDPELSSPEHAGLVRAVSLRTAGVFGSEGG